MLQVMYQDCLSAFNSYDVIREDGVYSLGPDPRLFQFHSRTWGLGHLVFLNRVQKIRAALDKNPFSMCLVVP